MKFLIDNQLPLKLSEYLNSKGLESSHVLDFHLETASDQTIWSFAKENEFIIVSKDEDFLQLSFLHKAEVTLIHVALGNCRNKMIIDAFEKTLPQMIESLHNGDPVIEIY